MMLARANNGRRRWRGANACPGRSGVVVEVVKVKPCARQEAGPRKLAPRISSDLLVPRFGKVKRRFDPARGERASAQRPVQKNRRAQRAHKGQHKSRVKRAKIHQISLGAVARISRIFSADSAVAHLWEARI